MSSIVSNISAISAKSLIKDKKVKQIGSLYTSMLLSMIVGIGISIINTRLLGPQQFGDYKFLQNLFTFAVSFLTLGFFVSGSRLLAQRKNETIKHEIMGGLVVLAAIISVVLAIGLFGFSFFEERIFQNKLGRMIRIFSPLLFVYPFQLCLNNIMQGDNRIYELSIFRLSPRILYLLTAILFNYFVPLKLVSALAIQFLTLGISILIVVLLFRPKFKNLKSNFLIIWRENTTYGYHVYVGIIIGVTSAHLGGLSIAYFIDNTNVGFFSLASTITMPLTMISSVAGTTFFKDFANRNSIPQKATAVTLVLSTGALIVFFLVINKVVILLYSNEYAAVVTLSYWVSIGCVFHGFGDYINRFLGAHGKGKELRNSAILVGFSNILGFTILVYMFGVKGAAITKLISGLIYFAMMYFFYLKYKKELEQSNNMPQKDVVA